MKKEYIQPVATLEEIETLHMIAESEEGYGTGGEGAGGGGSSGPPSGPGGMGAKQQNLWDAWDDDSNNGSSF